MRLERIATHLDAGNPFFRISFNGAKETYCFVGEEITFTGECFSGLNEEFFCIVFLSKLKLDENQCKTNCYLCYLYRYYFAQLCLVLLIISLII